MYNNILPPNPLSTPPSLSQRVCLILENASYISHETSRGLSVRSSTRVTRHFVRPSTRPYAVPRGRYAVSNFRHLNIISEATCIDLLPGPRGDQIARMWLYGSIEFVGLSRFFFFLCLQDYRTSRRNRIVRSLADRLADLGLLRIFSQLTRLEIIYIALLQISSIYTGGAPQVRLAFPAPLIGSYYKPGGLLYGPFFAVIYDCTAYRNHSFRTILPNV